METAAIGALGVAVGAIIQLLAQYFVARADREHQLTLKKIELDETHRSHRYGYLVVRMEELLKACAEFERFLGQTSSHRATDDGVYELATIIGNARAACLAVGDTELTRISRDELTYNRIHDYESINRAALEKAIMRLADIIKDSENSDLQ